VGAAATECGIRADRGLQGVNLAGLKTAFIVTASDRARGRVAKLPLLSDHVGLLGTVAGPGGVHRRRRLAGLRFWGSLL